MLPLISTYHVYWLSNCLSRTFGITMPTNVLASNDAMPPVDILFNKHSSRRQYESQWCSCDVNLTHGQEINRTDRENNRPAVTVVNCRIIDNLYTNIIYIYEYCWYSLDIWETGKLTDSSSTRFNVSCHYISFTNIFHYHGMLPWTISV